MRRLGPALLALVLGCGARAPVVDEPTPSETVSFAVGSVRFAVPAPWAIHVTLEAVTEGGGTLSYALRQEGPGATDEGLLYQRADGYREAGATVGATRRLTLVGRRGRGVVVSESLGGARRLHLLAAVMRDPWHSAWLALDEDAAPGIAEADAFARLVALAEATGRGAPPADAERLGEAWVRLPPGARAATLRVEGPEHELEVAFEGAAAGFRSLEERSARDAAAGPALAGEERAEREGTRLLRYRLVAGGAARHVLLAERGGQGARVTLRLACRPADPDADQELVARELDAFAESLTPR